MMSSNAVIHEQCVRLEQASDRAWEEAGLKQYDTFEDYTEMLVQFGYVSFFSLAFPLAPLLALLNNLLELRTDAFKLCHTRQRPLAHKASGIGVWLHVLQIMSVLAVLTNCFHLAYSTSLLERAFPRVTAPQKVWIVFGIEHLLLVMKVWLAYAPKQEEDSRKVNLVSMDGDSFEVSRSVAAMSELVKTLISDDADDDEVQEIPLPNVKSPVLSKVIEFCSHHHNNPMREIEKPLKSADMHDVVSDWDANFVDI
ncbi:Anoctamin, partial [Phytophthora palmivora]